MGQATVYCHYCGNRINDKDLLAGRAVTLLDKTFCANCKDQAFAQLRGEPEPEAKAAAPAPKSTHLRPHRPGEHPARVTALPVRRKNPMPLYLGIGGGAVAILILIVVFASKSGGTEPSSKSDDSSSTSKTDGGPAKAPVKEPPAVDPEEEVRRLIKKAEELVAKDKEWEDFLNVRKAINDAGNLASAKVPKLTEEVDKLRETYIDAYEDKAADWLRQRSEIVGQTEREGKYKNAIVYLKGMPEKFKHSRAWKQVQDWINRLKDAR